MDTETKAKAKDNNRRLAALEGGVSALAIALTANGVTLADGADPIEAAIGAVKRTGALEAELHELRGSLARLAAAIASAVGGDVSTITDPVSAAIGALDSQGEHIISLEGTVADLGAARDQLHSASGQVAELEAKLAALGTPGTDAAELEQLRKRVTELTGEIGELEQDLADVTEAKNKLANQLADEGKGTGDVQPPAQQPPEDLALENLIGDRPELARDVGPAFGALTEVAIGRLIEEGRPFEIAFSNGEFEVVELQPVEISAADLIRVDSSRYIVKPTVYLRGGTTPAKVDGAGLLYQGEQVGYCRFDPSVVIHPGQERRFDRALIFG